MGYRILERVDASVKPSDGIASYPHISGSVGIALFVYVVPNEGERGVFVHIPVGRMTALARRAVFEREGILIRVWTHPGFPRSAEYGMWSLSRERV